MLPQVQRDHRVDGGAAVGVQFAVVSQVIGQGPGFVAGPDLKGCDELRLVDEADLQRDQSEEEVTLGVVGHGPAPIGGR
jgi:hypothetical protein